MPCGITLYASGEVRLKILFFVYFHRFSSTSSQNFIKSKNGSLRSSSLRIFFDSFSECFKRIAVGDLIKGKNLASSD